MEWSFSGIENHARQQGTQIDRRHVCPPCWKDLQRTASSSGLGPMWRRQRLQMHLFRLST